MDGCTLASGGVNSVVHLWDTPSGQVVRSLSHQAGVTHLQFIATPPALLDHDRSRSEAGGATEGDQSEEVYLCSS
jgi:WD40 repeat protein